ncbi:MAG: pancreas/duodenum homeobox protein 1 [Thermodesulfobacteriota bacterium]
MTAAMNEIFTLETMDRLFPKERSDQFFDALFGDADEGAYDIQLAYHSATRDELRFEFQLTQRPGKCLACNLTYGLPQVFARHPIINVDGVVKNIQKEIDSQARCAGWRLGSTREVSRDLHVIPLIISLS